MHPFIETVEPRTLLSAALAIDPGGPMVPAPLASLGTPVTIHAEATDAFTKTVEILPGHIASHLSQLGGIISWGDKTSSGATFVRAADGTIHVHGTHTYVKPGEYKVSLRVSERPYPIPGQPTPDFIILYPAVTTDAVVRDNKPAGVSLAETAHQSFSADVGSFDFANIDLILSAQINWGDGKTSVGQVKLGGGDKYVVLGTLTYAHSGTFKVQVNVGSHESGKSASAGTVADIFSTVKVKA